MTKAQMQVIIDEKDSTIHCLEMEKTKLANDVKTHKPQLDKCYQEINSLSQDVIHWQRRVRVLTAGQ